MEFLFTDLVKDGSFEMELFTQFLRFKILLNSILQYTQYQVEEFNKLQYISTNYIRINNFIVEELEHRLVLKHVLSRLRVGKPVQQNPNMRRHSHVMLQLAGKTGGIGV